MHNLDGRSQWYPGQWWIINMVNIWVSFHRIMNEMSTDCEVQKTEIYTLKCQTFLDVTQVK